MSVRHIHFCVYIYSDGVQKSRSVSLFAAALLFSAPGVECSIYSTCKRISQKLLRNVKKFLDLVFVGMDVHPYKVVRSNCEELVLQGPDGKQDLRVVNSYPSKVLCHYSVLAASGLRMSCACSGWRLSVYMCSTLVTPSIDAKVRQKPRSVCSFLELNSSDSCLNCCMTVS